MPSLTETMNPVLAPIGAAMPNFLKYWWVLVIILVVFVIVAVVWIIKLNKDKKAQWTHKLRVRRILPNKTLSDPYYINMKRFALVRKANVFELENSLLGNYLIPEIEVYSDINQYSIIIDLNNRLYVNNGETFEKDKGSVNVSCKHAEIDLQFEQLRLDWQDINKKSKRIEWSDIIKYASHVIVAIVIAIIAIYGMQQWGEAKRVDVQMESSRSNAMEHLSSAMSTIQATVNTQQMEITPMLKALYGTDNLQPIINQWRYKNETT